MGHRTLSLALMFRALFLDSEAFEELRDDDNPFIEGLFLVTLIGAGTALLSLGGRALAWTVTPSLDAVRQVVLQALQQQSWWAGMAANAEGMAAFQRSWDAVWQMLPGQFGASDLNAAALNLLFWPCAAVLAWLTYGVLAHLFARLLGGQGSLNQTLGATALASTPLLLRGLGFIPFFVIGGVLQTWQLILRYKALRVAHRLPWKPALGATLLPFVVYGMFWLAAGGMVSAVIALLAAGR